MINQIGSIGHYVKVRDFMNQAGQIGQLDRKARRLRATLILEEAMEACAAMGFRVKGICTGSVELRDCKLDSVADVAKELCDLHVVTTGAMVSFGIPWECLDVVDDNNLLKIKNGTIRGDGKLLKARDHPPVDFSSLLI